MSELWDGQVTDEEVLSQWKLVVREFGNTVVAGSKGRLLIYKGLATAMPICVKLHDVRAFSQVAIAHRFKRMCSAILECSMRGVGSESARPYRSVDCVCRIKQYLHSRFEKEEYRRKATRSRRCKRPLLTSCLRSL